MIYNQGDFPTIKAELHHRLMDAPHVLTESWQGLKNVPHTATRELRNVTFETPMPQSPEEAVWWYDPNMPWAEDHFQESVGGRPLNPGDQYMNWPWYRGGVEDHKGGGKFSHSYMERLWPRHANYLEPEGGIAVYSENPGIRYRLGDLDDLVNLLAREPHTRQAWLPIWFPEDTGAVQKGMRVPCSLGYQFMVRDNKFHVNYVMRSCDFVRYMADDTYLSVRLGQWVLDQLRTPTDDRPHLTSLWEEVEMGTLSMTMFSLHIFEGDMSKMRREAPATP